MQILGTDVRRSILSFFHSIIILFRLFLHAVLIAAVASVDFDELAFVDEEGHTNLSAGLESCGLEGVGGGITLEAGLGVGDAEDGLDGHFGVEDGSGVGVADNFYGVAFLHVLNAGDEVLGDGELLEGLVVHEDVVFAIEVEVLEGTTLNAHVFEALADVEALLEHAAADNVLEGGAHDGVTLTGLYVEEVDAEVELAVHADANALLDVLRFDHRPPSNSPRLGGGLVAAEGSSRY